MMLRALILIVGVCLAPAAWAYTPPPCNYTGTFVAGDAVYTATTGCMLADLGFPGGTQSFTHASNYTVLASDVGNTLTATATLTYSIPSIGATGFESGRAATCFYNGGTGTMTLAILSGSSTLNGPTSYPPGASACISSRNGSLVYDVAASNLPLSGTTGSIGGSSLTAGTCTSGTASITGATTSMVAVASPVTYYGDGFSTSAYVSAANTVTVKICSIVTATPTATTFNVRVLQ